MPPLRRHRAMICAAKRQAGWRAAGTGIYLPANGVRALGALGLRHAVAAAAVRIPTQRLLTHRGRLLAQITLLDLWGDAVPCLALPRAALHRILRDGVPPRLGATVRTLEQVDGPVRVAFAVLRAHGLSDSDILDVTLTAAARCFFSSVLSAMDVAPDDELADNLEPELHRALAGVRDRVPS